MALDMNPDMFSRSPEIEAVILESVAFSETVADEPPDYQVGVESSKTRLARNMDSPCGTYWERQVTMSDGNRHREYVGISDNSQAQTLVASIPAWWTSPKGGFNKETADKLMADGHHVLIKGVTENALAPLSRGAYDLHASLDYHEDAFQYHFGTDSILLHGDSNGAMQGAGVLVYAPLFGRIIEDAYLVDPCLVHKPGIADIMRGFQDPGYIPREIVCLGRQAIRMALDPDERAIKHIDTLEPSMPYIVGNLLLTKALFSGEFGMLARNIPPQQRVHFLLFRQSLANHMGELIDIVDQRTTNGVTYESRTGTHLSIANPRTVKSKVRYLSSASPESHPSPIAA